MQLDVLKSSPYRSLFYFEDEQVAYLDGNSLGRLPISTIKTVEKVLRHQWGSELIGSWNSQWLELPKRIGNKIDRIIGARDGETIIADSTSVNLFKLAWALLKDQSDRKQIVTDTSNFPTDLYVLDGLAECQNRKLEFISVDTSESSPEQATQDLQSVISDQTALVVLSHVNYRTGMALDLPAITKLVQEKGARVIWDLSHSVGVLPIEFAETNIDAAVGCTYKYLNGGPGAPAFLTVRGDLIDRLDNPIKGWFGSSKPFEFNKVYRPHTDIDRFSVGTPPILSMAAIESGVDIVLEAGIENLRSRSIQQTEALINMFDRTLQPLGFHLATPRNPKYRGSHVSLAHENAWQITQDLIQRFQVVPDFRAPDLVRLGVSPLYTEMWELERAIDALRLSVVEQTFKTYPETSQGVT